MKDKMFFFADYEGFRRVERRPAVRHHPHAGAAAGQLRRADAQSAHRRRLHRRRDSAERDHAVRAQGAGRPADRRSRPTAVGAAAFKQLGLPDADADGGQQGRHAATTTTSTTKLNVFGRYSHRLLEPHREPRHSRTVRRRRQRQRARAEPADRGRLQLQPVADVGDRFPHRRQLVRRRQDRAGRGASATCWRSTAFPACPIRP